MRSKKFFLMMLLMIVAVVSTACGGSKSASGEKEDTKKADNAEVKILSSEYTLPDDSSTNLHENELILKINVSVKNTGKEPLMVDKSQFSLYEGDSKMSDVSVYDERNKRLRSSTLNSDKEVDGNIYYIVEKGKKLQLEYTPDMYGENKADPVKFEIDGGSDDLLKTAKKLEDPAKALLAYTDVTIFGKDNDNFDKLVDENKREVVTDYLEGAQKSIVRSLGYYDEEDVDKKKLNKLISAIQNAYQEKSQVKAVTKSISGDEATVEATVTPIDNTDVQKKVKKRLEDYVKDSGKNFMSRDELINPAIDIMSEEIKKAQATSSEKTVEVKLEKSKNDKWKMDADNYKTEQYFSSFLKSND
ncbi:DUF4352 domain-containing protein [Bacillus paralicheniformis]|uniref:DUF4352 domain-containing protein n=1 Tax=Bacillus paralicheniformis TaxID=1648923 RepID=UPI0023A93963|nr:DUF4352 domain-containing protein [Bacillus paralicheniformis]WEA71839.1 DUF4352 domain-containing protein [Bacillus paralicheniformis]WHX87077.1 DUF4352 domain-containing protein [Bacillus paralicheniformis]